MSGTFADSNRSSLRSIPEASNAWATTPASGKTREMRITHSKLAPKKDSKMSEEIRSDRMVPSIIEVGASAGGDVAFEYSAGAMDDYLAAFLYGLWSRTMSFDAFKGVGVSITAINHIAVSGDVTGYFITGQRIKTEGFKDPANSAYNQIASIAYAAGVTTIVTVDSLLVIEASSLYTKVLDANDVIVLNNSTIRFGTAGASTIDSAGGNAFAAANAAGQLKVGQKLWIDGLGRATGTFTFSAPVSAGDQVAVYDGVNQLTFQFGGTVLPGVVNVAAGADQHASGVNLAAAIRVAFTAGLLVATATSVTATTNEVVTVTNLELVVGTLTNPVDTGSVVAVSDFAGGDATLRGSFILTSVSDDVLGVTPHPATNANVGAKKVTIKGSMLRNPSAVTDFVKQSFTVETSFDDVNQHFVGTGLRVGTFDLAIKAGEIVTGSIAFQGRAMQRRVTQTPLLRASPYVNLQATENEVLNATTNVGDLFKNGAALSTGIQSIDLKGDAALREQRAVGDKYAKGIGVGRFKLTGKFTAYFETGELFDNFVNHDTIGLSWFFLDIDGNRYDYTLPAIKLTSDPVAPEGIDKDVIEDIDWEAQRDPATNCMMQVDRFSSVLAQTAV